MEMDIENEEKSKKKEENDEESTIDGESNALNESKNISENIIYMI